MAAASARTADGELWIDPAHLPVLQAHGLDNLTALMAARDGTLLDKPGLARWRQRLRLELHTPDGPVALYLKRFTRPPWRRRWGLRLGGFRSFAHQECHWLRRAARLGLDVPAVVACGARGGWLSGAASCLLIAEVPGDALERWLPRHAAALRARERRALIDALADLVARFHGAGLYHRDLYFSHVFVQRAAHGGWALFLIDLQRVVAPRLRRRRWMIKDLAALNYSADRADLPHRDRLRWLRRYLRVPSLRHPRHRRLIRAVLTRSAGMARHSLKHGLG